MRHESRGLHYSRDFPRTLPVSFPTIVSRKLQEARRVAALNLVQVLIRIASRAWM